MKKQRVNVQLKAEGDGGEVHPELRVYLTGSRRFFGPGPCYLLDLVDETGSLQEACIQMGVSYSKGWHMVENIEDQIGKKVVERRRGGRKGGQSSLTEEGRALVEAYRAFSAECRQAMEGLFQKHFSGSFGSKNNEIKDQPS